MLFDLSATIMGIGTIFGLLGLGIAFITGIFGIGWVVVKTVSEIAGCDDSDDPPPPPANQ